MTNGAKEWAKEFGINVDEAVIKINKFADSSKQLSELKKGIGTITSAYNEKKDSENNTVSSDTLGQCLIH